MSKLRPRRWHRRAAAMAVVVLGTLAAASYTAKPAEAWFRGAYAAPVRIAVVRPSPAGGALLQPVAFRGRFGFRRFGFRPFGFRRFAFRRFDRDDFRRFDRDDFRRFDHR